MSLVELPPVLVATCRVVSFRRRGAAAQRREEAGGGAGGRFSYCCLGNLMKDLESRCVMPVDRSKQSSRAHQMNDITRYYTLLFMSSFGGPAPVCLLSVTVSVFVPITYTIYSLLLVLSPSHFPTLWLGRLI